MQLPDFKHYFFILYHSVHYSKVSKYTSGKTNFWYLSTFSYFYRQKQLLLIYNQHLIYIQNINKNRDQWNY